MKIYDFPLAPNPRKLRVYLGDQDFSRRPSTAIA